MNGDKNLFAFFNRTEAPRPHLVQPDTAQSESLSRFDGSDDEITQSADHAKHKTLKRPDHRVQKTLQEIYNPGATLPGDDESQLVTASSEAEADDIRRKRRRTNTLESIEVGQDSSGEQDGVRRSPRNLQRIRPENQSPREDNGGSVRSETSPQGSACLPVAGSTEPRTPPKKMLKLNASGKLSSPISKKTNTEGQPVQPRKRGRPRKSLIVKLAYSIEGQIGSKINGILAGEERILVSTTKAAVAKQSTPRKARPKKPTHPFFLGKQSSDAPPKSEPSRKMSAITPGKLRRQNMQDRFREMDAEATESYTSTLLKDRLIARQPGAKDPAWPAQGCVHSHGFDLIELSTLDQLSQRDHYALAERKQKAARRPFPQEESILTRLTAHLSPEPEGQLRSDGFRDPHPSLRLPERALLTASDLVAYVKTELDSFQSLPMGTEVRFSQAGHERHPAVQRILDLIPSTPSAFDQGRGETSSWTQKYAPTSAAQVLQPSREMSILRDWLSALRVSAVESASKIDSGTSAKAHVKLKKKRRPRDDDMDDFLVDDDDDDIVHEMDELAAPEEDEVQSGRRKMHSMVQSHSSDAKLTNLVLLSGPHGCGKSAAAYAVAKELGFKVFEVHSSERRSGKDVFDKVGDMSENHLMKHHGAESAEVSAAEEPTRNEEAFQRDLASGRQGKMNAFFKPKAAPKASQSPSRKAHKARVLESVQQALKKPPKDQQQSLVLLEEVDNLFKDDKDFWTSVLRLIASSKRPFIMTCNDEDLIPLQLMKLHAILRFSLPPPRIAIDYLLAIAAAEGHLLQRDAFARLYESKGHDLRASISELNFWCQMGVGDPRNGLSWINTQGPRNSGNGLPGQQIRVTSRNTYQKAMGLLPDSSLDKDSQLCWAYLEFGIEPIDAVESCHESSSAATLKQISLLSDALSAIDVFSGSHGEQSLDPTQKPMSEKARSHYIEGLAVLQTDEYAGFSHLSTQINAMSTLTAYRAFGPSSNEDIRSCLSRMITSANRPSDHNSTPLTRHAFACFDVIAAPTDNTMSTSSSGGIYQSVFDGPLKPIAVDVAPYVRSILHHEAALNEQREQLNSVMMGTNTVKQKRKTRAARSALEGSQRSDTRRERWFVKTLDVAGVMATGGEDWPRESFGAKEHVEGEGTMDDSVDMPSSSAETI